MQKRPNPRRDQSLAIYRNDKENLYDRLSRNCLRSGEQQRRNLELKKADIILKGVVRAERIKDPAYYIRHLMERVKPEQLISIYGVINWTDHKDFLEQFARKSGRLLKGGEPDTSTAARMMIYDWQRGKIPYYNLPPNYVEKIDEEIDEGEFKESEFEEGKIDLEAEKEIEELVEKEEKAEKAKNDREED